jgi:hypothetical protein
VPTDAHVALLHHWLHFRHKRRAPKSERRGESVAFPHFDEFCLDIILRSLALLHDRERREATAAAAATAAANSAPASSATNVGSPRGLRSASHQQATHAHVLDVNARTASSYTPHANNNAAAAAARKQDERTGLRRAVPPTFVEDLFLLLSELIVDSTAAARPAHQRRLVTRTLGRLAALLMPSQWYALLHRVLYDTTRLEHAPGLHFAFDLLAALHSSRHVTPLNAPAAPLNAIRQAAYAARAVAAKVAGHSESAAALVALEQCAASVHGVTALLVALTRHVLCAPKTPEVTRRHALLALRDTLIAIEV